MPTRYGIIMIGFAFYFTHVLSNSDQSTFKSSVDPNHLASNSQLIRIPYVLYGGDVTWESIQVQQGKGFIRPGWSESAGCCVILLVLLYTGSFMNLERETTLWIHKSPIQPKVKFLQEN